MGKRRNLTTAIVIDDNDDILSLFIELLEMKNFKVIGTGHNGMEAVELFEKLKPDITFLDVVMPNSDGLYALRRIREIDQQAVVIMVTTDISEDTAKRMEDLKATAVIYKPFEINDLVKIVHDIESDENIGRIKFFN